MYQAIVKRWKQNRRLFLLVFAAVIGLPILATQGMPSPSANLKHTPTPAPRYSGVSLPENYRDTFVHYATIQRPDGTIRDVFINPDALDYLKRGYGLRDGATIVIEGYYALKDENGNYETDANGHYMRGEPLDMIHVRQKRADWAEGDFVSEARAGNWNFGSFDFRSQQNYDESITACFNCHNASEQPDFLFTYPELLNYEYYRELQYFTCNLTGRTPCE